MNPLEEIRAMLLAGKSLEAIGAAKRVATDDAAEAALRAEAYYIMGNAYRQLNDWKGALGCYCEAVELDSSSPAAEAYNAAQAVLGFYDHDLFNP